MPLYKSLQAAFSLWHGSVEADAESNRGRAGERERAEREREMAHDPTLEEQKE